MKESVLLSLICEQVRKIVRTQNVTGEFEGGHNGPYNDNETPVRNTAHWLFALSHFAGLLKDENFISSAHKACDYLVSSEPRPMKASFFCRANPEKDFCNGLMGQAWAMEALIAAGRKLGRKDAIDVAREVFFLHPWLERSAVWRCVAVDGSYLEPDNTFNHQLWFAAIASQLNDEEATRRALRFLDIAGQSVQTYRDGVVFHQSRLGPLANIAKEGIKRSVKIGIKEVLGVQARSSLYSKSVGYHGFNMYAFALLKERFPEHPFWFTPKFKRMLGVSKKEHFLNSLDQSAYGWPYNPPGIEFAFVGEVFGMGHDYCKTWITRQFERTYNNYTDELLTRNVPDPATSSARIYEAVRLKANYSLL